MNRTRFSQSLGGTIRHGWPPLLLMAAVFLLYANTFGAEWNYDDFPVIVENPDVRSWAEFFRNSYPGRPLRELTYLFDHAFFGLNPAGWHVQNIFWHGLNAVLLFALIRRLKGGKALAWLTSLIFLVHPVQVEVVANISHRKDSLALAFMLLTVLAYTEAFQQEHRRTIWMIAAGGSWILALLAKETAIMLPVILAAWEYVFLPPERSVLLARWRWGAVAGTLGGSAAAWWFFHNGGINKYFFSLNGLLQFKANYFDPAGLDVFYRMVLKSWAFMFLKVLHPADLAVEYTYPVPASWADPWTMGAIAGIVFFMVLLAWSGRRRHPAFLAVVWISALWLPVSNLWPMAYFAADRYLYAPMAGVSFLVAILLLGLLRHPAVLAGGGIVLVAGLALLTWEQNKVWRTPESLWSHAYRVSPQASFALNNLGSIHYLKGDLLGAILYYDKAAKANPLNPSTFYNLGLIYEQRGDMSSALTNYDWFIRLDHPMFRAQAGGLRERLLRDHRITISPDIAGQGPFLKKP